MLQTKPAYSRLSIGFHWLMVVLLVAVYACILLREIYPRGSDPREALKAWHFMLGLSVFSTALAFVIYFRLLQTLGTVGATAQAYLRVPIGVAIGVVFLGEHLSATAWLGLACIIPGVMAMTLPDRKTA